LAWHILTSKQPDSLPAARWDAFVAAHPSGHLLQATAWGTLKSLFSWRVERVALADESNSLVAGAQVLFRPTPGGKMLAYVPKGPLIDWHNDALAQAMLAALHAQARAGGAFALTVEPEAPDDPALAARLQTLGFRPAPRAIQPRSTIWLDLAGSPDDWLARMRQKTRYNVRLAARKGVTIRDATEADLPAFVRLLAQTGSRDGFAVHSTEYYTTGYHLLVNAGAARLLLATHEDEVLAGILVAAFGASAWYLWGASGDAGRERMPNHLLQWEAMQWAAARGCRTYDLWGIPDEVGRAPQDFTETVNDRSGGLWGVYRFKQGFGGQVVSYVGAWDYVYAPLWYAAYRLALRWRNKPVD
jgi:peptidoglycan pentaglycine glycine transferase (the first glycine)